MMKNLKNLLALFVVFASISMAAQAPQKMSYQAVVRNATGNLVTDVPVGIRISILQGSASGTAVYTETHNAFSNANGLVSIEIGGGDVISGNFSTIDWGNGSYFVKTETDPNGGSNFTISGTSQLLSVPYAIFAENTRNQGRASIYLTDDITDAEAAEKIAAEAGPNTDDIYIVNTTALTTVNIDRVSDLRNIVIQNNSALQSVVINTAKSTRESFTVISNPALTNLALNSYMTARGIANIQLPSGTILNLPGLQKINCQAFIFSAETLNFPTLVSAYGHDYYSNIGNKFLGISAVHLPALTTLTSDVASTSFVEGEEFEFSGAVIDLPVLTSLPNQTTISIKGSGATNINLPVFNHGKINIKQTALTSITSNVIAANIIVNNNNQLTTVNLPMITSFQSLPNNNASSTEESGISWNANLTSVSFPSLNTIANDLVAYPAFRTRNNKLSSVSINAILHQMISVGPVYGLDLSNQAPAAPPTGQGIIDKQTLIAQGKNVLTDN